MMQLLIAMLLGYVLAAPGSAAQHRALPIPPIPLPRPAGWAAAVDHPFFPLRPGTIYIYSTTAGAGTDIDTITVTHENKTILGIPAVVVRDRSFRKGVLIEDTADWYAQDRDGNVWYLGEDTKEYRNGKVASTAGSWEAGKNGARPGFIMKAHPHVGDAYRQEYRRGAAEDMARVLNLDEKASVPAGTYAQCIQTEEWSPLEPKVREHKYYARGIGMVLERTVVGGSGEMALVKVISP